MRVENVLQKLLCTHVNKSQKVFHNYKSPHVLSTARNSKCHYTKIIFISKTNQPYRHFAENRQICKEQLKFKL